MGRVGKVSEITCPEGERSFRWVINSYQIPMYDYDCLSPVFNISDSSWRMEIWFTKTVSEWGRLIKLSLCRCDLGCAKTITYTLGIEREPRPGSRNLTLTKMDCFTQNSPMGSEKFMLHEYLSWDESNSNPLSVICRIKCETPRFAKAEKSVSCAIQRKVPDSLIDKEKHKDEDLSSLDIKGIALLSDRMKSLLMNSTDYDLKIYVKDKEFLAHRNILGARSPVFAMMMKHDTVENSTGTIMIEDCDPDSFDEFLLYVYSGRTQNLTPEKSLYLYYTADKYDFPVLKKRCVSLMKWSISVTSICDVILLAARHQEKELLDVVTNYFARNMKEILLTVEWQTFLRQNPVEANELLIKSSDILIPKK